MMSGSKHAFERARRSTECVLSEPAEGSPQTLFVGPRPRLPRPLQDLKWENADEAKRLVGEFSLVGGLAPQQMRG
jgi:hypothetical protein